jgi:membrane-associated protease RseP (regulator of RpoE activity)
MPSSLPDSSTSPPPSATPSADVPSRRAWRIHAALFAATLCSVFFAQAFWRTDAFSPLAIGEGAAFTGTLLGILFAHELGHYVAARLHEVDASLPFFIPLPLPPFGTMGAVIQMRSEIPNRRALLDIGASGPLAGLVVAIPAYVWGVSHSFETMATPADGGGELGESVLVRVLDHFFAPHIAQGVELVYSPVALAAWAGFFFTMMNLVPIGQLDAGHVAYALFGRRQNRFGQIAHRAMLAFFVVSVGVLVSRDLRAGFGLYHLGDDVSRSLFWLLWFEVQAVLGALTSGGRPDVEDDAGAKLPVRTRIGAMAGLALLATFGKDVHAVAFWFAWFAGLALLIGMEARWGVLRSSALLDHPPTPGEGLGVGRTIVAIVTLVLFALLFMPVPIAA